MTPKRPRGGCELTPWGCAGRLEDLSEEEEDEQDEEAVEAATGPPWKCALCPGVLLLKEETVAQHAASKARRTQLAQRAC